MSEIWRPFPTGDTPDADGRAHDSEPTRVVLDMDTGVDDAVALVMAMHSAEIVVEAITSVAGNAPVDECTRNNLLLSELIRDHDAPPVARGAASPLSRPLVIAPEVHGGDGLGGVTRSLPDPHHPATDEPAHEVIARVSRAALASDLDAGALPVHRRPMLIATGPLTNLALALERDSHALDGYARIVIMGGAFDVPGNTGPVAEFNFYVDPEAAAVLMASGLPITLVPLDATTTTILPAAMLVAHAEGAPPARPGRSLGCILYRALDYYIAFQEWESGLPGGYMHDPLAVAAVIRPEIVETEKVSVDVLTDGADRGRSIARAAESGRTIRVVRSADKVRFLSMLEDRVLIPAFISREYAGRCTKHDHPG